MFFMCVRGGPLTLCLLSLFAFQRILGLHVRSPRSGSLRPASDPQRRRQHRRPHTVSWELGLALVKTVSRASHGDSASCWLFLVPCLGGITQSAVVRPRLLSLHLYFVRIFCGSRPPSLLLRPRACFEQSFWSRSSPS